MTESDIKTRVDALLSRDRAALSRTITLIESSRENDRNDADKVMKELFNRTQHRKNKSIRIGICGSPGAGKSTMIEKLGLYLVE